MIKSFYIVQLSQIGNVGAHEIKKIKDQPKEGFRTNEQAETHLKESSTGKSGTYIGINASNASGNKFEGNTEIANTLNINYKSVILNSDTYPYNSWFNFSIMPIYSI